MTFYRTQSPVMHFKGGRLPLAGNCWTGVFANFCHQLAQKTFPERKGVSEGCVGRPEMDGEQWGKTDLLLNFSRGKGLNP